MAVVDLDPLVAKAKEGDRQAFDSLVRLTYGDVYNLAVRLTGNDDDASDVVQEAYVRAFRGLRRFRGDAAFSTWLYRIATNCAYTLRTRRARLRCDELSPDLETRDPDADPWLRVEASSLRLSVDKALQKMPTRLRDVFVLREVYDLSHREIADRLGISESATKVRLHRARLTLRRMLHLREDGEGDEAPAAAPHDDADAA